MTKVPGPRVGEEDDEHKHNASKKVKQPRSMVVGKKTYEWWKCYCSKCDKYMKNEMKEIK